MRIRAAMLILCGGLVATAAAPHGTAQDPQTTISVENTLTSEERAKGWKLLFDGKTTAGWRGFKQQEVPAGWQAVDGALTRTGRGGDLITVEQFDSFDLALEWKIAEGGNSGIMFRVSEEGVSTYHTGPELQVLDNTRHRDGKSPLTSAGSCYALYPPVRDVTKPVGSWNQVRLLVNRNHVEHWLNGVKVVEYELFSPDWEKRVADSKFKEWPKFGRIPRGHIALQDHGDRVAYRNIRIRPLK